MVKMVCKRWLSAILLCLAATYVNAVEVTVEGKHPRSDGSFHAFNIIDGDALSPGDRFQIVIDTDRQTYYSIIYISRDGDAAQIFPPAGRVGRIAAGRKQVIPDKKNFFTLDTNGGRELMFIVTGNNPLGNLKSVLKRVKTLGNVPDAIHSYLDKRLPDIHKLEIMNTGRRISGLTDQVASGLVRDLSRSYAANPWSAQAIEQETEVRKRRAGDSSIPDAVRRRAQEVRSLLRRPRGTTGGSLRTIESAQPAEQEPAAEKPQEYRVESRTRPSTSMELSTLAEDKMGVTQIDEVRQKQQLEQQHQAELEKARLQRERAEADARRLAQEREEARRLEQQRIAAAKAAEEALRQQQAAAARAAEAARVNAAQEEAARQAEMARIQAEEEQQARLRAEADAKRLEEERLEAERLAQAQREAERAAEEARRIAAARAEAVRQRVARERAEREKAEALKREAQQLEQAQQEQERQRLEMQRLAAEKAAAEERARQLAEEKAAAERLRLAKEEAERLEVEARRLQAEKVAAEQAKAEARRLEAERIAAEKAAEAERLAEEKRLAEQRARDEKQRREAELKALKEAEEEAARLQAELAAAEQARLEKERAEQAARKLAQQRAAEEAEQLAAERQARKQAEEEAKRLEQERLALEEKLRAEQVAAERAAEQEAARQQAQAEKQKQPALAGQQASASGEGEPGLLDNVLGIFKPAGNDEQEGTLDSTVEPGGSGLAIDTLAIDNPVQDTGPREAVVALQAPSRDRLKKMTSEAPRRPADAAPVVGEELRSLYAQIASSIVSVRTRNIEHAAGFILNEQGHVLTGWHVVEGAPDIRVEFMAVSGVPRSYQARVIQKDKFRDLALLELVDAPAGIQPISLLQGDLPEAGTVVRVFGHRDGQVWATDEAVITRIAENFTWFSINNVIHRGEVLQVDLPASGQGIGSLITDMNYQMLGVKSFSGRETGRTYAVSVRTIRDFLSVK